MPENSGEPEKYYPSLHLDDVPADSPLLKKKVGETCEAMVTLRLSGIHKGSSGNISLDLQAMSMELNGSGYKAGDGHEDVLPGSEPKQAAAGEVTPVRVTNMRWRNPA